MSQFIPYFQKLKDPRWQRVRLEMLKAADWSCSNCGDSTSTLEVHHNFYLKGKQPWEVIPKQLAVLCSSCHQAAEESKLTLQKLFAEMPPSFMADFWIDLHWGMNYEGISHFELMTALTEFLHSPKEIKKLYKRRIAYQKRMAKLDTK